MRAKRNTVVMRVREEHRPGRGKYWAPNGWGYTDHVLEAGHWTLNTYPASARADAVPLEEAFEDEFGDKA